MYGKFKDHLQKQIDAIISEGLYKTERVLTTPQGVEIKTDKQGRVAWENAPDQEMLINVHKSGYMLVSGVRLRPDRQEHEITLPPALTVNGTVTDSSTGKLIPRCRLLCGWPENYPSEDGIGPSWSTLDRFWVSFEGGVFRHTLEEAMIVGKPNPGYVFKFKAEGYAPSISRAVAPDEGEVRLDIKLQPAATTTVAVLLPDGRPAVRAEVGLVAAGSQLRLLLGHFDYPSYGVIGSVVQTDANGQVRLPPDEAIRAVVAVLPQGYAEAAREALQAEPTLRLLPWGRIEGTCSSRGQPVASRELALEFIEYDFNTIALDFKAYRTTTDVQGRFTFLKVPPRRIKLSQLIPEPGPDGSYNGRSWSHRPLTTVEVKPGETTQVELGKSDRPVVMRLRWPDGWQRQPGWAMPAWIATPLPIVPAEIRANPPALAQWWSRPENQALLTTARAFPLRESGNGSWTAEDVPPGNFVVRVYVHDTNAPAGTDNLHGHFEIPVVVPDDSSISNFDLGELLLHPAAE